MFDRLDPIWLFIGGGALRYGGDLLKLLGQFGIQKLTSTLTIAETNPIYSAICWELDRSGKVKDFNELTA
jgi:mitochondrial chaperone BCS1